VDVHAFVLILSFLSEWSKKKKDIEKRRLATQENSKKKYSEIRKKKTSFEKIVSICATFFSRVASNLLHPGPRL
jgi:uncharacterized membrane protein